MSDPTLFLASRQEDPIGDEHWTNGGPGRPPSIDPPDIRAGRTAALTIIALAAITVVACACVIVFQ